jgi:hypothetical protein
MTAKFGTAGQEVILAHGSSQKLTTVESVGRKYVRVKAAPALTFGMDDGLLYPASARSGYSHVIRELAEVAGEKRRDEAVARVEDAGFRLDYGRKREMATVPVLEAMGAVAMTSGAGKTVIEYHVIYEDKSERGLGRTGTVGGGVFRAGPDFPPAAARSTALACAGKFRENAPAGWRYFVRQVIATDLEGES